MTEEQLRELMRKKFKAMSAREWCRLTGCNHVHVSEFVAGRKGPPNDMLRYLNLEIHYVRKRRKKGA